MNKKYKYCFKTKKDFISEFGHDWRYKLNDTIRFVESMDHLLGTDLEEIYQSYCNNKKNFTFIDQRNNNRYTIIPSMYKKIILSPIYKPKTFIY